MNKEKAIKILKLEKKYTKEQLKKQYRLLALKIHPDKNTMQDANEKFQELNEAYSYLSNEKIEDNETYNSVIKNFILLLIDSPFSLKMLSDLDLEILELINKCLKVYYSMAHKQINLFYQICLLVFEDFLNQYQHLTNF